MTRPTTEALKTEIEELVEKHNDAVKIQQDAKQRIIEIQAILQDRAYGDTNDSNSADSTN
jgi:low affinity Fe/Cu permease